jgi:CheY-like chemotaxis protein
VRLEALTVGQLRRAVEVYAAIAWKDRPVPPVELPGRDDEPVAVALAALDDETLHAGEHTTRRHALRLGNPRYPFMKLVLQEHLVEDEFFFEVDTHDQMFGEVACGDEAAALAEVKRYNLEVKEAVEHAWSEAGLPTAAQIKGLVATWPARRAPSNGRRVLLVDNDRDIAATLALLLEARGYEVTVLSDGTECVEQADPARHDLILMDNEMRDLNGFQACRMLKERSATAGIPVLIATAGVLTLEQLDAADGFMVKPFRMELLFSMLDHILGRRDRV